MSLRISLKNSTLSKSPLSTVNFDFLEDLVLLRKEIPWKYRIVVPSIDSTQSISSHDLSLERFLGFLTKILTIKLCKNELQLGKNPSDVEKKKIHKNLEQL